MAESVAAEESKLKVERVVWVAVVFSTVSVPFIMTVIGMTTAFSRTFSQISLRCSALVHIDDCPHQPFIPLAILMAGLSMSLSNVVNAADKYSPPKQSNYKIRKRIVSALNLVTNCFTVACFVSGMPYLAYLAQSGSFSISHFLRCHLGVRERQAIEKEVEQWLLQSKPLWVRLLVIQCVDCVHRSDGCRSGDRFPHQIHQKVMNNDNHYGHSAQALEQTLSTDVYLSVSHNLVIH